jgi:exopolysaccharide biosynthesis polyprenyl glycosylphosphotransferase
MLGFTATDTSVRPEDALSAESLTVVTSPITVRRSPTPASQDQRRTVGMLIVGTSVAIETAAVLFWLRTMVAVGAGGAPRFFAVVYVALAMAMLLPTYRRGRLVPRPAEVFVQVLTRLALVPILTAILTLASQRPLLEYLDMRSYTLLVLATVGTVMLCRLIMFKVSQVARSRGYDLEDTLIVGAGPVGVAVAQALEENFEFGLVPYGFVDRFEEHLPYPIVGRPEDLLTILEDTRVRHVVLAFGATSESELVSYVRNCSVLPVQFYAVPRFFELGVSSGNMAREVDGFALQPLRRPCHGHSMWPAKRAFDLMVSSLLLLLTAPIMLACAVAVKLSSPGPVFFKQVRVGVGGRPFEILKFRSMRVNDDHGTTWSVDDDQRVTKVGAFLRKSHLDELPQLINVVRGEMSIVGPRPERPYFVDQFSNEIEGYHERHRVPVGITGWAQVNGFWGDTSIEARVRLDNRYIENWSLWRDLVIAMRTIPTLLGKRR